MINKFGYKRVFPVCGLHRDCFANKAGRCICLSGNDFGKKDCPFYKNRIEAENEQRICRERLISAGKDYLLDEYESRGKAIGGKANEKA